MYLYFILAAVAGLVAGIVMATRSKKSEGVVYGILDKVGRITNFLLIPIYAIASIFCLFVVMFGYIPDGEGAWAIVAWLLAIVGATGPAFCGLGLGASVALRKNGKSKPSFWIQFAGVVGLGITILFFVLFSGNLFGSLN